MDGWKRFVFGAKNKSTGGKFGALSEANGLEADDGVGLYSRGSPACHVHSPAHKPKNPGPTRPRRRRSRGFAYEQEITGRRVPDPAGRWRAAPGQLSSRGLIPPRILRAETLPTQEVATMDRHTGLNGKYHWPTGFCFFLLFPEINRRGI